MKLEGPSISPFVLVSGRLVSEPDTGHVKSFFGQSFVPPFITPHLGRGATANNPVSGLFRGTRMVACVWWYQPDSVRMLTLVTLCHSMSATFCERVSILRVSSRSSFLPPPSRALRKLNRGKPSVAISSVSAFHFWKLRGVNGAISVVEDRTAGSYRDLRSSILPPQP